MWGDAMQCDMQWALQMRTFFIATAPIGSGQRYWGVTTSVQRRPLKLFPVTPSGKV
jgi:hypothetical protein